MYWSKYTINANTHTFIKADLCLTRYNEGIICQNMCQKYKKPSIIHQTD